MSEVVLIIKVEFDNMENHNPIYEDILGFASTELEAAIEIGKLEKQCTKRKCWDGYYYPQFKTKRISKVKVAYDGR